jgi:hypothetical protein
MKTPRDLSAERRALSFLRKGSLVRRAGTGWRFGTAKIPDMIVERLIEAGKAVCEAGEISQPKRNAP